jgi:hypothetical protein
MHFTNPEYDQISEDEVIRQQQLLRPLREMHMREMLDSGLAARVMNVPAIFNRTRNRDQLTEGSLLSPFRTHLWDLQSDHMKQVRYDIGLPARPNAPDDADQMGRVFGALADNYVLHICRRESLGRAASLSSYAAGVLLNYDSSFELGLADARLPFIGVAREDLTLLATQMDELTAFADDHGISIIDRATLMEGRGEYVAP